VVVPSPAWFVQHTDQLKMVSSVKKNGGLEIEYERNVFTADGRRYGEGSTYYTHGNNLYYYQLAGVHDLKIVIFEDTLVTPLDGGLDFAHDAWRGDAGVESIPDMNLLCFQKGCNR
jgi:hypothetical protein